MDNSDFIKIKNSSMKYNIKRIRRQASRWEKIYEEDTSVKDSYPKYTKNPQN